MCCLLRNKRLVKKLPSYTKSDLYEFLYTDYLIAFNKCELIKKLRKEIEACVAFNAPSVEEEHPKLKKILKRLYSKPSKYELKKNIYTKVQMYKMNE